MTNGITKVLSGLLVASSFSQAKATIGAYETTSTMSVRFDMANAIALSPAQEFQFEQATSLYFSDLVASHTHSAFQKPNELLDISVSVYKQRVEGDSLLVESNFQLIHLGDQGLVDMAALLMFLTNKNTTDSSFATFDSLIDLEMPLDAISFVNKDDSFVLSELDLKNQESKYSKSEKTLIVVTSILSFALFVLSIILIWIAGGWLALRKQVRVLMHREEEMTRMTQHIKENPTEDTQDEEAAVQSPAKDEEGSQGTNPSGILGVNPYYGNSNQNMPSTLDGLGIKMTPARRSASDLDSEIFTPMSQATTFSDTGRAPIGITSMRKLVPGKDDEGNRSSLGTFGMRLEY